jgi:hypothetical protein
MKINLTIRWIAIGIIWSVVLFLTVWNMNKIDRIVAETEKEEVFRMDDIFWNYNSGNISKVLRQRDALTLPIDSVKLGLLSIENNLTALISKYHFNELQFESLPEQTDAVGIPITLSFEGSFEGILPWLNALENDLPYLPVRHLKITADPFSKQSKFQVWLNFRYKIKNLDNGA